MANGGNERDYRMELNKIDALVQKEELTLFPLNASLFCRLGATFQMLDLDHDGHTLDLCQINEIALRTARLCISRASLA